MTDKTEYYTKMLSHYIEDKERLKLVVGIISTDMAIAYSEGESHGMETAHKIFRPEQT